MKNIKKLNKARFWNIAFGKLKNINEENTSVINTLKILKGSSALVNLRSNL